MKLSAVLHDEGSNNSYMPYGENSKKIPQEISGTYFYFDPEEKAMVGSFPCEDRARDWQFAARLDLAEKEVQYLLEDPYRIGGLKQWLIDMGPRNARTYIEQGVLFPKENIEISAQKSKEQYPMEQEDEEELAGIITAIVLSLNQKKKVALTIKSKEHTVYAAMACVPKNLRRVALTAPYYDGVTFGNINLLPENWGPEETFSMVGTDRYSLKGLKSKSIYKTVWTFLETLEKDEYLKKWFCSEEFEAMSSQQAAQAVLNYPEYIQKYREEEERRLQSAKTQKITRNPRQNEKQKKGQEEPVPVLLESQQKSDEISKEEKQSKSRSRSHAARKNLRINISYQYEILIGILLIIAAFVTGLYSVRIPQFTIRFEIDTQSLAVFVGLVLISGPFWTGVNDRKWNRRIQEEERQIQAMKQAEEKEDCL